VKVVEKMEDFERDTIREEGYLARLAISSARTSFSGSASIAWANMNICNRQNQSQNTVHYINHIERKAEK